MDKLYIDFETYYDKKQKYDLASISIVEYVHDPRFEIQGAGVKVNDGPIEWLNESELRRYLSKLNTQSVCIVAHNVKFDGAILQWRLGFNPAQWVDTQGLAKAILGGSVPSVSLKYLGDYFGFPPKGDLKTNGIKTLTAEQYHELGEYCKRDTEICYRLERELGPQLPEQEYLIMDWTIRTFLNPVIKIDKSICEQVLKDNVQYTNKCIEAANTTRKVLASNPQFAQLLQDRGYFVPMKKNKYGRNIPALSIGDKEFQFMRQKANPELAALLDARIAVKQTLEQTRAEKMANIADISDYCFDIIYSGALQTHRFSGGNGCAGNPQNFGRTSALRKALHV